MSADKHDFTHNQIAAVISGGTADHVRSRLADIGDLELEVLSGDEGLAHLDPDGSEHGLLATLKRTIQEEKAPISMLADALEANDEVLFIHHVDDGEVSALAQALSDLGASLIFHFSDYTWRRVRG